MQFPRNEYEWKLIAKQFEDKWQYPYCLGAADGKHVRITAPHESGSFFWNYKGYHSIVLFAIANANYEFILCDVGVNGRVSDGGVIETTEFYHRLKNDLLNIPKPEKPTMPYVFIGDEAFALKPNFLKPFCQKELNEERRIFNYRLSRARRVVENVFGILVSRFRIFQTPINFKLETIDSVIMACCVLHNFLRQKCTTNYITPEYLDVEEIKKGTVQIADRDCNNGPSGLQVGMNRNASAAAKEVRESYVKYFQNEGAIEWQNNFV